MASSAPATTEPRATTLINSFLNVVRKEAENSDCLLHCKVIWGGLIFSVSNGGDDDHAMNTAEITR
jgi:hypothetical protein